MINFLIQSFKKAINDSPSKVIYDFVKYLFILFIPYISHFFSSKMQGNITFQCWVFASILIFVVLITYFFSNLWNISKIKAIKKDAYLDETTQLPNYKALNEDLDKTIEWAKTKVKDFSIILIDIDNFKDVNTKFGYEKADKVMEKLGIELKNDNRVTDKIYRYHKAGDEFIIILKDTTAPNAKLAAERKRKWIADLNFELDISNTTKITVCCGITSFKPQTDTKDSLLERVNQALLTAKRFPHKNNSATQI